jgi:hypothetical protein
MWYSQHSEKREEIQRGSCGEETYLLYERARVHHIQHFEKVIQVTNSWKRQSGKRISKCVNNKRTPPRATPPPEICLRAYGSGDERRCTVAHTMENMRAE